MKFIIDAQLPRRLSHYLNSLGHDSIHTKDLAKANKISDVEITAISLKEKRIVISKDSDFYDRYLLKLEPYKLLIIGTGNIRNADLLKLFEKNIDRILEEIAYNFVVELTSQSLITIC